MPEMLCKVALDVCVYCRSAKSEHRHFASFQVFVLLVELISD